MKLLVFTVALIFSQISMADVAWKDYSEKAVAKATKEGKTVVLGFHKQGCGTCHTQDKVLEETGITKKENVVFFKVERKNKKHDAIYEKYGFSKRQWASLVLLKNGKEFKRIKPGVTDESEFKKFAQAAI